MKSKTIQFLEQHQSETPSRFVEMANWRRENRVWLRWSQAIALALISYMENNKMNRSELAARLGVSTQYLGRLLSGKENLSLKSIANIEERLGIVCFSSVPEYATAK